MAKPRFWRLKLKTRLSLDEAQAAVADREGTVLRVDTEGEETTIYFSSTAGKAPEGKSATKLTTASLKQVSLAEVTKVPSRTSSQSK